MKTCCSRTLAAVGLLVLSSGCLLSQTPSPIALENPHLALRFDSRTGAWTGLADRATGQELVTTPGPVAPPSPISIVPAQIRQSIAAGLAVDLQGQWLYTPAPPPARLARELIRGIYSNAAWSPTSVPSRRGSGDDRLHERTGDFWYRQDFVVPAAWPEEEMAVIIGAVDDFDVTYLNGRRLGSTGQETPHFWEVPRLYRFHPRLLKRGATNTILIKVTNGAYDGGLAGPVALGLAASLHPEQPMPAGLAQCALRQDPQGPALTITVRAGLWEYQWSYIVKKAAPFFSRQLTVRNTSTNEEVFQTAHYLSPAFQAGPRQAVIFPGSLPVGDQPLTEIPEGEKIGPQSQEPLVALWEPDRKIGVGGWFYSEDEYAPVTVRNLDGAAQINHSQQVIVRLRPGESVTLGRQFFWLAHGARDELLAWVQAAYREVGLRAPDRGMPALAGMVIYCGHPGGPPELEFLRYGGFKALSAYVPTLRRMNVDLLWLLPTWEHGDDRRWNLYAPFDHYQVDHLVGTAQDLKTLGATCHTNGIGLMFDLVPHGPPDFTPLAKAHPEWVARKPDGAFHYEWGQYAFDNHHPGWQDYMSRAAEWGAREFGAVGARVDCGAGGPLNWNPQVTRRPSHSSLAAGLGMNQAIREGYLRATSHAVLLPEEYTGASVFHRVGDLTYDAQLYFLQADLLKRRAPPEEWAASFQQFLHDQQLALPPGGLKMRWISNHDTVSWTFQKMRPVKAYGLGCTRALMALCALIEGVPMLYQGDEDPAVYRRPGESNVEFLSGIYGLRKHLPALRQGGASYLEARATKGVFACWRSDARQEALVLISFSPEPVQTTLSLPARGEGRWQDALSTDRWTLRSGSTLAMAPWQTRVLVHDR